MINEEKPDYTVKMWLKNYERIEEYYKRTWSEVSNFFINRQFFKLQKLLQMHMGIHNNLLTNQNRSPARMSLSGEIFNLVSSLTNEWTPPL